MVSTIVSYLVSAMMVWCPLSAHRYSQSSTMTDEQKDAYTLERYQSIATDLAEVATDPDEKPLFKGDGVLGRLESALLALSIASFESGEFREDVDTVAGTGDHGRSHCIMQVLLRPGEEMNDRKDCFRLGFSRMRESFDSCPSYRTEDKLSVYARGTCDSSWGIRNSRMKMRRAKQWMSEHIFFLPFDDKKDQ